MSKKIFESMVRKPQATNKWLFFPVSLFIHGLVILAVIVMPLLNADNQPPEVKIFDVFLQTPPPPQTPAPPKGKRANSKGGNAAKPRSQRQARPIKSESVIPINIPDEIPEESFDDIATTDIGGDGLVEGGVVGVDIGIDAPSILGTGNPDSTQEVLQVTIVQPPRVIKRVAPLYPKPARMVSIEGVVSIEAMTDIYGRVTKVNVVNGHPLLRSAAIQAVKQWIYEPYMVNGIPKPVLFTVNVIFKIDRQGGFNLP